MLFLGLCGLPAGIVFVAQLFDGGGAGSWATGVNTILCAAIFIFVLVRGEKEITRLDWICFLMVLASIALWGITKNPLGAVILITVADFLGCGPTIRKSNRQALRRNAQHLCHRRNKMAPFSVCSRPLFP
jgi:hypothetical protein